MGAGQDRRHQLASRSSAGLAGGRWPARAQQLIEAAYTSSVEGLHEPLKRCLGAFEEKLFALAERSPRADEQQDLFASRQRVMQEGGDVQQRFLEHLGNALNAVDGTGATASPSANGSKPWLSLELLDPAVQELSMAVDQIGARGEVRHSSQLHELGYRFAVLIGSPPLEGKSLPLGPHALASAFKLATSELALPLKHQLLLLQQFDQSVIASLSSLYSTINAQLQSAGILPQLRSVPLPRRAGKQQQRQAPVADAEEEAPAAAEPPPTEDRQGRSPAPAGTGNSIEVLESLRDLLAQRRASQGATAGASGARAASEDELQTALGALQQHLAQVTDNASRELRSAARLREELLAQLNLGKPADAPQTQLSDEQGDTVELVAGLFEQLGQQLQHGGDARALLGNMQLPLLRMAVADPAFFERREHPARRLLDAVTSAANDWLDGSDDESNRPLATKLEQLVKRANQEPPSKGLYTSLLADIEHHLALLTRKAQAAERRHVEAAKGRERLDLARRRASELMAERFAQAPPRGLLRTLLDRAWSDVLALTLLRHGEESDAFKGQLEITDQLLGRLPIPDRLQLQQDVESGLQQIGMHAEESVQVAQRLIGAGTPDSSVELPSATDLALRLKQHQRLGELQSQPEKSQPEKSQSESVAASPASTAPAAPPPVAEPRVRAIEQHIKKLPFGTWFEFVDPASGQLMQRKLAWYSPMSGRCLLVSRRGQRGEEMTLAQLAQEVASGRVCEVPTQRESLLDRAWRNLTGNLRQSIGTRRIGAKESTP
ncbi:MAG: DUF1631 family protein [Pseudomonadota bacterium]|nr:DUF1631 family protein [Pseudomonadota bacterium]